MWRIREGNFVFFFHHSTFIKGKVFPSTMYVCVCLDMCALCDVSSGDDRPRRQAKQGKAKHHKKETIHRHQHDEEKNLQISIACVCICKISYVYICMCVCKPTTENFRRGKIFYLFLISIICISSRHVCVHTFSEKIGKMRRIGVLGRC